MSPIRAADPAAAESPSSPTATELLIVRPQTNGKVERYQRTLSREWARSRAWNSNAERAAALPAFLHRYNYTRPHTALKGEPPASRLPAGVNNLAA